MSGVRDEMFAALPRHRLETDASIRHETLQRVYPFREPSEFSCDNPVRDDLYVDSATPKLFELL
jgi:hypothetical protein